MTDLRTRAVRGGGAFTYLLQRAAAHLRAGGRVVVLPALARRVGDWAAALAEAERCAAVPQAAAADGGATFGDYSFAATVGLWLGVSHDPAARLLDPYISTEGFAFTPAEYLDLRERLRQARRRHGRQPDPHPGLSNLNTGFFRHQTLAESTDAIGRALDRFLATGSALYRRYVLAVNGQARARGFRARADLRSHLDQLDEVLNQARAAAGQPGRAARRRLAQLRDTWLAYRNEHLPELPAPDATQDLTALLEADRSVLTERTEQLPRELKAGGLGLSAVTADPRFGSVEELRRLEVELVDLLRELDESGLYQLPLRTSDAATTPRQLQQLEGVLQKLRATRDHLPEFPVFYEQQHFWYAQPATLRRLLGPLRSHAPEDWEAAFSGWYFERCLEQQPAPPRPRPTDAAAGETPAGPPADAPVPTANLVLTNNAPTEPAGYVADDLLLAGPTDPVPEAGAARLIRWAELSDTTALPYSLAGHRDPVLTFRQSFYPLHPPRWTLRPVAAPPPGPGGHVLVAPGGAGWGTLTDWTGASAASLDVYLPAKLTPEGSRALLQRWEALLHAAPALIFRHTLGPDELTQRLLSDGFTADFLVAALLRAAEAAEGTPFDRPSYVAMGREVRLRCGWPEPAAHPLAEQTVARLRASLPDHFFTVDVPWRDTRLPAVVQRPSGGKVVLLPAGRLPGYDDAVGQRRRQTELRRVGYEVLDLDPVLAWEDPDRYLVHLTEEIKGEPGQII